MRHLTADDTDPANRLLKNKEILLRSELSSCGPSDQIVLNYSEDAELYEIYKKVVGDIKGLSSDIFFSGDIPLRDCEITVDERGFIPNGKVSSARVWVNDKYEEALKISGNSTVIVGAIEMENGAFFTLGIANGYDGIIFCGYGLPEGRHLEHTLTLGWVNSFVAEYYYTWYAIQILLLNPDTKEIVGRSKKEFVHGGSTKPTYKRRAKYIKVHRIDTSEIKEALGIDEKRPFNRKTLAWYVIGHWRHYKDGRTIFVKGFWKGEMRHLKRNLDSGRERLIDGARA